MYSLFMSQALFPTILLDETTHDGTFTTMGNPEATMTGGMSRAAKKRAKKKQKQGEVKPAGVVDTIDKDEVVAAILPAKNAKRPVETDKKANVPDAAKKPKRHETIVPEEHEDEPLMDEVHSSDDDDEEINMGVAQQQLPDTSAESAGRLPNDCQSLLEILSMEQASTRSSSSNANAFTEMTSRQRAHCALRFFLQPACISVAQFYAEYWETKPLHVSSKSSAKINKKGSTATNPTTNRLDGFLSLNSIRKMLRDKSLYYGKDLNVTRYEKGRDGLQRRVTLDKLKDAQNDDDDDELYVQANSKDVWRHWDSGCTIRLLCPHKHSATTHALLSLLELEWGCMVGANAYLTPANSAQGFAPHYDDIEAFCLQLEGKKRWKVYAPLAKEERLPRTSSSDYTAADLKDVEPVLDVVLEPGDVLYMPRGWIHQACTLPAAAAEAAASDQQADSQHSLHLTVSAMQQWAWADFMEVLLPQALDAAIEAESTSLRQGLPPGFLDYMGAMHDNRDEHVPDALKPNDDQEQQQPQAPTATEEENRSMQQLQQAFRSDAKKRIMRVAKEAIEMVDAACDQMGKRFIADRLPPALTETEKQETNVSVENKLQILPNVLCRLARPGIARLVLEHGMAVLYHCADNSVVYQENPPSPMEFEIDDAPALEQLLTTHEPHWICVADLIHDSLQDKMDVAQALYDEGILAIRPIDE